MASFKKLAGAPPSDDDTDDPIAQAFRNVGQPAPQSAQFEAQANRLSAKPVGMPTRMPNETLAQYQLRLSRGQ